MPRYLVSLPVVGVASIEVEANDAKSAITVAMEEITSEHLDEWETVNHVTQGNVCYAPLNSADVTEIEDDA